MLASRLKILFDDAGLRKQMGLKARRFAEDTFSLEDVIQAHLDIYQYSQIIVL